METLKEIRNALDWNNDILFDDIISKYKDFLYRKSWENISWQEWYYIWYKECLKSLQDEIPDRSESVDYIDYLLTN